MDENFAPDGIDTSSDDIYNVHNTNFNRSPHVKSLILEHDLENQNPRGLYLQKSDTMDLYPPQSYLQYA